MPIISFILPVYNVESYLDKCMASLYAQGLKYGEYEIILVNDGSTDSSLTICNNYSRKDPSVVVIDKGNEGVASARNAGIEAATGDYLCFVDPDDYLNPGSMSFILDQFMKNDFHLIRYWSRIIEEKDVGIEADSRGVVNFEGEAGEYIARFGIDTFCWSFLYNRNWLNESCIRFSNYRIAEDFLFIAKVLLSGPRVRSTTCLAYNYVKHPQSVTGNRSASNSTVCVSSFLGVFDDLISFATHHSSNQIVNPMEYTISSIQDKMHSLFSRIMTSDLTTDALSSIYSYLLENRILPLPVVSTSFKNRVINSIINICMRHPALVCLFRPIYNQFFIPYVLKRFSKN